MEELSKQELLEKIEKAAYQNEMEIHGCGRCTLASLVKYLELGDDSSGLLLSKAILPLSGGIAGTRNTCGALLGGLMAIGIASFPGSLDDTGIEQVHEAMALGNEYYRRFEKEIGNSRCFDIRQTGLGRVFDTGDPDEYEKFVKAGGYELCSGVVDKAARLAAEFILNLREQKGGK